jgi:predicted transcriptional regulator
MSEMVKINFENMVETQDLNNTTHIKNELLDSIRNSLVLKGPLALLFYLIRNKAFPMQSDNTKHKIKEVWYDQKGKIVASRSVERMATDLGVHRATIIRWLDDLVSEDLIRKEKEFRENVYVLGEIKNKKEIYFYAEKKDDKLTENLRHWVKFLRQQLDKDKK